MQRLLARGGIPSVRLDADAAEGELEIDFDAGAVRIAGTAFIPTAIWTRHFSTDAMPGDPFLRESWQATVAALTAMAAVDVAPPSGLLTQLQLARAHQIAVPRTLISTDPAVGRALGTERVVVKALHRHFTEGSPGRLTGRFPRIVERCDLERIGPGPPAVVQEHVDHDTELRVYYLGGPVLAFAIAKGSPADPWTAPERVAVAPVEPPAAVADAVRCLAEGLKLHYGAFDFLIRDGVPVFLEANPDGDWRWIERRTGTGTGAGAVTLGVARLLADLHRRVRPDGGRNGSLSLLTFLA